MPRISLAFDTILDFTDIADANGQEMTAGELGLTFELAAGMGPLEFTIKPTANFRFSINDILNALADILNIPVLKKVTALTSKKPWSLIFETQVSPSLRILVSKTNKAISLVLTLYESRTAEKPGIKIGGKYGIITIEPIFYVYDIIIGYDKAKGGMDVSARVEFEDQKKTQTLLISDGTTPRPGAENKDKTQVVKFPFPVPNQGTSTFKINYVGLGQRFGPPLPTDPNKFSTALETIFKDLIKNLTTNDPQKIIKDLVANYYHPDREWFIAVDLELKGWQIRFIFNDPVLYGLQIDCTVPNFKGLQLIILYIKLGPHLGVYYGKLTIPEQYRQLNFGAAALTLPSIEAWIYTNGDFKISVGWPLGKESIGIEVYIFTGGCGFYFGKLRSGDNPQNPGQVDPYYNPIIIFGLGVWFGLGRSFRKGPLSASLSLTLQGTFQGILAWEEEKGSITRAPDYFWFAATVGVVGTLQGAVDLKIIKISILVQLSVTAGVAFETDYNTLVNVTAKVKVKASVKVLFITISVGFSATISQDFYLTHGGKGNASLNGPQNPAFKGLNGSSSSKADDLDTFIQAPSPQFVQVEEALLATDEPVKIGVDFLLYPAVVFDATSGNGPKAVAILSVDSTPPKTGKSDWENLMDAYASWLLTNYSKGESSWQTVVNELNANGNNPPAGFDKKLVEDFFATQVELTINGIELAKSGMAASENEEKPVVFFPILPNLEMTYDGGSAPVKFSDPKVSPDFLTDLQDYFGKFSVSDLVSNMADFYSAILADFGAAVTEVAFNGLLFTDYFLMAGRQLAQQMADEAATNAAPSSGIALNVGAFVSRFLLHGLVVPKTAGATPTDSLYAFTGQQFPVDDTKPSAAATIAVNSAYQPESGQPDFSKVKLTLASGKATIPLIKAPTTAPAFPGTPTLLSPLETVPLWVAARERLPWTPQGEADQYIVPLPTQIKTLLISEALDLNLQAEYPHSGQSGTPIANQPGLLIPIKISQVNQPRLFNVNDEGQPKSEILPTVFQISGTDDETRDMLQTAIKSADFTNASITLLYNASKNGYLSDKQARDNTVLFKTNLSTSSEPDNVATPLLFTNFLSASEADLGAVSATQSNIKDFLLLVWENSVVNANGFFLNYQNADKTLLPDDIFKAGQADLQILVSFPAGSTFHAWHNVLSLAAEGIKNSLYIGGKTTGGKTVLAYHPNYPTGCIGFELANNTDLFAATDDGENTPYSPENVEQLYHMIQYQLPADAQSGVKASGWGPSVGPSSQDNSSLGAISENDLPQEEVDNPESYRQIVPVYNFVEGGGTSSLDELPNVYAAVGKTSTIQFRLVDIYGNVLSPTGTSPQFTVKYTDPIVSLAEWPGVQVDYNFTAGTQSTKPTLNFNLSFDPAQIFRDFEKQAYVVEGLQLGAVPQNNEDRKQQAQIALYKLSIILNQLNDPNTHFALSTTLFQDSCSTNNNRGKVIASDEQMRGKLQDFAKAIMVQVKNGGSGTTPEKESTSIQVDITPTDVTKVPCDLYPLTVWVSLFRDKYLPGDVDQLTTVKENAFVVKPRLDDPDAQDNNPVTLTTFASVFESIFKGFDGSNGMVSLATRTGNANFSATGNSAYLWAFKWSDTKGFSVQFDPNQFTYYTLAPLSNELLPSITTNITTYDSDLQPTVTSTNFSNIDVDAFAQTFLSSVDEILTPEIASAISKVDSTDYASIMDAKSRLAATIKYGLIPVFTNETGGDLESAKDRFEQAMLEQLIRAYTISSIVQSPATVKVANPSSATGTEPPRLYGGVNLPSASDDTITPTKEKEYTLSNGRLELGSKANLGTTEYLNFIATAKQPTEQANLELDLEYNPVFVEHLVDASEEDFGYTPSSWLRFVKSENNDRTLYSLGTANIPIPLRVFPENPIMRAQTATAQRTQDESIANDTNPVVDALQWKYTATVVDKQIAAQDEMWFDLKYNLPVTNLSQFKTALDAAVDPLEQLFIDLARFNEAYASVRTLFLSQVSDLTEGKPAEHLDAIIKILTPLIQNVTTAYEAFMNPTDALVAADEGPGIITRHFILSFKEVFTKQELTLFSDAKELIEFPATINGVGPKGAAPVEVPPAEAPAPGTWYKLVYPYQANEKTPGSLAFQWTNLDAIDRQTAKTIYWIRRNADLGATGEKVNDKLIYQTAETTFSNPILPLLTVEDVEVAATTSLQKTLKSIFEPFAKAGTASTKSRLLKVESNYSYNLVNLIGVQGQELSVPTTARLNYDVNLLPEKSGNPDDNSISLDDFTLCLANDLTAWQKENRPKNIPKTFKSKLHFNVTLFAIIDHSQLPLIIVKNIYVDVPNDNQTGWWSKTINT